MHKLRLTLGSSLCLVLLVAAAAQATPPPSMPMHDERVHTAADAASTTLPAAPVVVTGTWIRWLPSGLPMGGYMDLQNHGSQPLKLVGADSPSFGMVMLHRTESSSGMERMVHVDSVTIPAGGSFQFAPGAYHLMLMHAKANVKAGSLVTVVLHFDGYAPLPVLFTVKSAVGH